MMGKVLAGTRSTVAVSAVIVWIWLGGIYQRLGLWPAVTLFPRRRRALVSAHMRVMSRGILALLTLGGARATRAGSVPTDEPVLVLMNHQSLVDILTLSLLGRPYVPWFVSRRRYGRFVPTIAFCQRLLGCPIIEPSEPRAALATLADAARRQDHGIAIFPEGHRTRDGEIGPFHSAGLQLMLRQRPVPVYAVVSDGFWTCRRLVDFMFNIHKIDGRTEVLGPFPPPEPDRIPAFVDQMREKMVAHLHAMRGRDGRL